VLDGGAVSHARLVWSRRRSGYLAPSPPDQRRPRRLEHSEGALLEIAV
jgi:hypothetical protein